MSSLLTAIVEVGGDVQHALKLSVQYLDKIVITYNFHMPMGGTPLLF